MDQARSGAAGAGRRRGGVLRLALRGAGGAQLGRRARGLARPLARQQRRLSRDLPARPHRRGAAGVSGALGGGHVGAAEDRAAAAPRERALSPPRSGRAALPDDRRQRRRRSRRQRAGAAARHRAEAAIGRLARGLPLPDEPRGGRARRGAGGAHHRARQGGDLRGDRGLAEPGGRGGLRRSRHQGRARGSLADRGRRGMDALV